METGFPEEESRDTSEALCKDGRRAGVEDSRCVDWVLWFRGDTTKRGSKLEDGGITLEGGLDNSEYGKTTSWNITYRLTKTQLVLRFKQW